MNDRGLYMTFRFRPDNPEHIKAYEFLKSDEVKEYGSKNKFIADAILHYLDFIKGNEIQTVEKTEATKLSSVDIEHLKQEIMIEVQREVLSLITSDSCNKGIAVEPKVESNEEAERALDSMILAWEEGH